MADDPDDLFPSGATTRRGFLSIFGRRAAQALPDVPEGILPRTEAQPAPGLSVPDDDPSFDEEPPDWVDPILTGEELVEEIRATVGETGLHLWWLGQAGFLVSAAGATILVDPYLSNTMTERFGAPESPYDRITGIPVEPELLSFVDTVICTSARPDHLDEGTLPAVLAGGATFLCAAGAERAARERAGRAPDHVISRDTAFEADELTIHAVPAYNVAAPESVGVVVRQGAYAFYASGDTRRVQGIAEEVAYWGVDVAMLPINGNGNMNGADAARLAYEGAVSVAIPCHYEMFRADTASPSRFVAECVRLGQEYRLARCGEQITIDRGY